MLSPLKKNILVSLVRRIQDKGLDLGKIQFQKLVYFLQEKGTDLNYDYEIHHYGPYCFELANDLDSLNVSDILDVSPDKKGYGYHIFRGRLADSFSDKNDQLVTGHTADLDFVIDNFGGCDPGEIELKATLHYVSKVMRDNDLEVRKDDILRKTGELKPKFAENYIEECYEELNSLFPLV